MNGFAKTGPESALSTSTSMTDAVCDEALSQPVPWDLTIRKQNGNLSRTFGPPKSSGSVPAHKKLVGSSAHKAWDVNLERLVYEPRTRRPPEFLAKSKDFWIRNEPVPEFLKRCRRIHAILMNRAHYRSVWPFYKPVDLREYPDYAKYIKQPMDLATIRTKLDQGKYGAFGEYVADMRLIIANSYSYNFPGDPVFLMAEKLQAVFSEQLAITETNFVPTKRGNKRKIDSVDTDRDILVSVVENREASDSDDRESWRSASVQAQIADLQTRAGKLQEQIELLAARKRKKREKHLKLKQAGAEEPPRKRQRSKRKKTSQQVVSLAMDDGQQQVSWNGTYQSDEDDDLPTVMTKHETRDLTSRLQKLSNNELSGVASVIQKSEPTIFDGLSDDDEFTLDLDMLKAATQRAVEQYMSDLTSQQNRQTQKRKRSRSEKHVDHVTKRKRR